MSHLRDIQELEARIGALEEQCKLLAIHSGEVQGQNDLRMNGIEGLADLELIQDGRIEALEAEVKMLISMAHPLPGVVITPMPHNIK